MGEIKEASFGKLVLARAWFGAWAFFESWQRDAAITIFSLAIVGVRFYLRHGWPTDWWGVMDYLGVLVAPVCLLWLALFLWHFWLAPSAIAYEAAKEAFRLKAQAPLAPSAPRLPTINWAIWKARDNYNLVEFAAILAKDDPSGSSKSYEAKSFLALIQEDVTARKLAAWRDQNAETYFTPDLWPSNFNVKKPIAIQWADEKSFDVTHIK